MARAALTDVGARQLEAVLALAEYGSFVAAAARLRISQPALTRMLNDLGITVQSVREVAQERRGLAVISCVMSVAVGRLPRMIAACRGDRPGVEIHVREGVYASILDDVRSGVADFGIGYVDELPDFAVASAWPSSPRIRSSPCRPRHPRAAGPGPALHPAGRAEAGAPPRPDRLARARADAGCVGVHGTAASRMAQIRLMRDTQQSRLSG